MENKVKIHKYKSHAKELNSILNRWDPLGILPFEGGPKDEYECFIDPILSVLQTTSSRQNLVAVLNNHLVGHMGLPANSGRVVEVADTILRWWNNKSSNDSYKL